MLRAALIVLGALLVAGAALATALGAGAQAWGLGVFGALLLVGTLFERRYGGLADRPPGAGWEPSGERFRDPTTGAPVAVWFHPATGRRRYVRMSESGT